MRRLWNKELFKVVFTFSEVIYGSGAYNLTE